MIVQFRFPEYSFLYGFLAIVCSIAFIPLTIRVTRKLGLLDIPGKFAHKTHTEPVPMAGGTALILSLLFLSSVLGLWKDEFLRVLLLAASIIYFFGLLDDVLGFSAFFKLTGQLIASLFLVFSDVSVHFLSSIQFPLFPSQIVALLDIALTLFWLIGVTNAMNMIDSMDGIAV